MQHRPSNIFPYGLPQVLFPHQSQVHVQLGWNNSHLREREPILPLNIPADVFPPMLSFVTKHPVRASVNRSVIFSSETIASHHIALRIQTLEETRRLAAKARQLLSSASKPRPSQTHNRHATSSKVLLNQALYDGIEPATNISMRRITRGKGYVAGRTLHTSLVRRKETTAVGNRRW